MLCKLITILAIGTTLASGGCSTHDLRAPFGATTQLVNRGDTLYVNTLHRNYRMATGSTYDLHTYGDTALYTLVTDNDSIIVRFDIRHRGERNRVERHPR